MLSQHLLNEKLRAGVNHLVIKREGCELSIRKCPLNKVEISWKNINFAPKKKKKGILSEKMKVMAPFLKNFCHFHFGAETKPSRWAAGKLKNPLSSSLSETFLEIPSCE